MALRWKYSNKMLLLQKYCDYTENICNKLLIMKNISFTLLILSMKEGKISCNPTPILIKCEQKQIAEAEQKQRQYFMQGSAKILTIWAKMSPIYAVLV